MQHLGKREVAGILAALRLAQEQYDTFRQMEHHEAIDSPLSPEEIDQLCESLNCQDDCEQFVSEVYIIITGNPINGIHHYGPFDNSTLAANWAEHSVKDTDWWIVKVSPIDDAISIHSSSTGSLQALQFFASHADVLMYISSEFVATLEDDLQKMESSESEHYTDDDRAEMKHRLADVRLIATSIVERQAALMSLEHYQVLGLSTVHLTPEDISALQAAATDSDEWMILEREPGFFIKLYEELENNLRHGHSDSIKQIIRYAHSMGFRMIEFDADAAEMSTFPVYRD